MRMDNNNTERQQLSRAISFARQGLSFAFHDFALGNLTKVTATANQREAREALELLRYLREVARILLPLTHIVPDMEDVCLRWLENQTTRIKGRQAKKTLARVLKTVDRIEDRLTRHLATPPPFAKSCFAIHPMLPSSDAAVEGKDPA